MTVADLIEQLAKVDPNCEVFLRNPSNRTQYPANKVEIHFSYLDPKCSVNNPLFMKGLHVEIK